MRIGSYEVEGELGRGGTGIVYRARGEDGALVAIKLLVPESAEARARFGRTFARVRPGTRPFKILKRVAIGVYSDGARHLTVVARTLTGRRLFADFDGDVVSTNLGSVIDLLQLV